MLLLLVLVLLPPVQAMNGSELDGRRIKVRFTRRGRTDASNDDSSSSGRVRGASSGDGQSVSPTETESRVVVSNLPEGFTWREVFGMCSLFGEVNKVKLYLKSSSSKDVTGLEDENDEQVEQDAAAVGDAAAADEDVDSSSAQQQQQQRTGQDGGSAVVMISGRDAAERVVAELNNREVQGSRLRASFYRSRPKKKAAAAAAASSA
jgi:RNA recognition motif-containing protein